jgi:DNA-binding MarR family transcriptional regulator
MSNNSKRQLLRAIGDRVQAYQDATDEVDETVARALDVNRTDLRCLSVLSRLGAVTAGELAAMAGVTRGAMTTALDRLERAGYARRVWGAADRRSVRVELTEDARKRIWALYGPLAAEGAKLLQKYTLTELAAVLRYLEEGQTLQRAQAERIRHTLGSAAKRPSAPSSRRP